LLNIEIARFQKARITRDQVSSRQAHNVAGGNIASPKFPPLPVPQHAANELTASAAA
jgi:hypothetical protein